MEYSAAVNQGRTNNAMERRRKNNDLQNSTWKTKNWITCTQRNMEMKACAPVEQAVFTPLVTAVMLLLNNTNTI